MCAGGLLRPFVAPVLHRADATTAHPLRTQWNLMQHMQHEIGRAEPAEMQEVPVLSTFLRSRDCRLACFRPGLTSGRTAGPTRGWMGAHAPITTVFVPGTKSSGRMLRLSSFDPLRPLRPFVRWSRQAASGFKGPKGPNWQRISSHPRWACSAEPERACSRRTEAGCFARRPRSNCGRCTRAAKLVSCDGC
jgi:hypothetical protein